MIAEFQFETEVLRPALEAAPADAAEVSSLDGTESVPLCAALWLAENGADVQDSLARVDPARDTTEVAESEERALYRVRYGEGFDGTTVYRAAVEQEGVLLGGRAGEGTWELRLRFPDRDAAGAFRQRCGDAGVDGAVDALYECDTPARAARFSLTEPQRRALVAAGRHGYFEVPRQTALSGLAQELDVSSQAASERVRRGLDTLVEETLLSPERGSLTR
jgi:predicted DNA binding protein